MYGLGGPNDIHSLFFVDKQHQDENGMVGHMFQALGEVIADRCDDGTERWRVFTDRFKAEAMFEIFGATLPSSGFDTPKLHSKVCWSES